jgi:RNA polymerase primary sigma factor
MEKLQQLLLKDIGKSKLLKEAEQIELIAQAQKNKDHVAINKLVNSHLRIILSTALKFKTPDNLLPELINEGVIGLIQAIFHYKTTTNNKFISYAIWWVRQAMIMYIQNSRLVRVPANIYGENKNIEKAKALSLQKFNRLNMDFITTITQKTVTEIERLESNKNQIISLNTCLDNDEENEDRTLIDNLQDMSIEDLSIVLSNKTMCKKALEMLKPKERKIVELYFGIEQDECKTLEEIGEVLNITKERVRQIKQKAIEKLKLNYHKF